MTLQFASMDRASADAIAAWRYEKAYAIYDGEADGVRALLNPAYRYYAITDDRSETIGFCCFGADARVRGGAYADAGALDVGAGMRPDLAGQGRGAEFVGAILEAVRRRSHQRRSASRSRRSTSARSAYGSGPASNGSRRFARRPAGWSSRCWSAARARRMRSAARALRRRWSAGGVHWNPMGSSR